MKIATMEINFGMRKEISSHRSVFLLSDHDRTEPGDGREQDLAGTVEDRGTDQAGGHR